MLVVMVISIYYLDLEPLNGDDLMAS